MGLFNFSPIPFLISVSHNKLHAYRLDNDTHATATPDPGFSSNEELIADFTIAEVHLRKLIKQLNPGKYGFRKIAMLAFAHGEEKEFSSNDRKLLTDLAEHAGSSRCYIFKPGVNMSPEEMIALMKKHK